MFDLDSYLRDSRQRIEVFLDRILPPETERPVPLHKAMRYSVLGGGKRLRPALCMASAAAFGAPADAALFPAAALEVFHTYTLVHDDLPCMDDDDTRRGRPTCHIVFGESTAVLAGDALQTLAFELIARMPSPDPAIPARLVVELATAGGSRGVAGGQVEDLAAAPETVDAAAIEFIHRHKTADLFRAAVRMGALTGSAPSPDLEALTEYAEALGLAFQAVDDLLDWRERSQGGTEPGEVSCVTVYGEEGARRRVADLTARSVAALGLVSGDVTPLRALAEHMARRTL